MLEEALASVCVDERHAVAVCGEVGDEQQHLLTFAKRLLGERQCAVKGLLALLNAALKPAEHLGERFFDLVERKRPALRSQVLRLLQHVDGALVGAILLLGQKPACAVGAQQAAHLGFLRAHLLGGIGGAGGFKLVAHSGQARMRELHGAFLEHRLAQHACKRVGEQAHY